MTMSGTITRRGFLGRGAAMASLTALPFPALSQVLAEGGILRARIFADISNLDPAYYTSNADRTVMQCIFAPAMEYRTGTDIFEAVPLAFESVKQIDPTHVGFTLRQGIQYSDGFGEMTAEDVKFCYERIAEPANSSPYANDWVQLDHVEVTGRYTGTIVLKAPFAPLFTSTLPGVTSCILPKAAIDAAGGKFSTRPPCTSGPYRIREWTPRTRLVLERNPDWTLYEPAFDEIHLSPIEDPKTAELGFEAGDLDFIETSISSISRFEASPPVGSVFKRHTGLAYTWLGMNEEHPKLSDQRVRRAIQHAVDRDAVVAAAYLGGAEPSAGIIAPGLIGHRAENLYNHDPDLARSLLAEAGQSGVELTLSIQQTAEYLAAAQVIQANLADVGIKLEINQYETGSFWSLGVEADGEMWRDLQLFVFLFAMQPDPSWATVWFTSEQAGVWNWQRFRNQEYDRLNAEAVVELDAAKRGEMYIRMQDILEESGDCVFLNYASVGALHSEHVVPALRPDGEKILPRFTRA